MLGESKNAGVGEEIRVGTAVDLDRKVDEIGRGGEAGAGEKESVIPGAYAR